MTRQFAGQALTDLTDYLESSAQAYRLKQIHSNLIFSTEDIQAQGVISLAYEEQLPGDALLSSGISEAVWVCSADCVPLLIGDPRTGRVAAIHAGWRGTALGITPLTVLQMLSAGSKLQDLRIALGPAISRNQYQVDQSVAVMVGKTLLNPELPLAGASLTEPGLEEYSTVLSYLETLENSPIAVDPIPNKVKLDVRRMNELQLERLGISGEQMTTAPFCTFADQDYFFSYRRSHRKQVQWSGIVSR